MSTFHKGYIAEHLTTLNNAMGLFDFLFKKNKSSNLIPDICPCTVSHDIAGPIDAVDWKEFETAYGNAQQIIPAYLKNLFCTDKQIALNATHQLWCSICHQHAYISSAAVPAYPVLIKALEELDEEIQVEILDIIKGFSSCLERDASTNFKILEWELELKHMLVKDEALFQELSNHINTEISDWANSILADLHSLQRSGRDASTGSA